MKTQVEIISTYQYNNFKPGDKGYIDGYVNGADGRPYAVVIVNGNFDLVPFSTVCIKAVGLIGNKPQ